MTELEHIKNGIERLNTMLMCDRVLEVDNSEAWVWIDPDLEIEGAGVEYSSCDLLGLIMEIGK